MAKKLTDLSDENLLLELAGGEPQALDVLYLRHSARVLQYVLKRGLARDQAEDVLQIVFMQIYRKKHLYDPRHAALAWIYVITRSELKDYRNRELKTYEEIPSDLSHFEDSVPIVDEANKMLSHLKGREQEVLKLRYLEELEYKEIAALLGESENNIRQIVSRGLKYLRSIGAKKGES